MDHYHTMNPSEAPDNNNNNKTRKQVSAIVHLALLPWDALEQLEVDGTGEQGGRRSPRPVVPGEVHVAPYRWFTQDMYQIFVKRRVHVCTCLHMLDHYRACIDACT